MNCLWCGKVFEAKRKTARYCSPKCRVYYNRFEPPPTQIEPKSLKVIKSPTEALRVLAQEKLDGKWCQHGAMIGVCKHGCK